MDRDDSTFRALTCREVAAFVMDYLDDVLPAGERRTFEAHLAECEDCIAYLRSYRDTIALARTAGTTDDGAAAAMPEALVQAILAASRPKR